MAFLATESPHFGDLWETTVKSFKRHLYVTVRNSLFTYEQFNTVIVKIESILNSRPLTPLSADANDLNALTPAHVLLNNSLMSLPEQDITKVRLNRLSIWQHTQKIKQDFWKRGIMNI